jgi:hypothetical protein
LISHKDPRSKDPKSCILDPLVIRKEYNDFRPHCSLQGKMLSQVEWEIQKGSEISDLEVS